MFRLYNDQIRVGDISVTSDIFDRVLAVINYIKGEVYSVLLSGVRSLD